MPSYSTGYQIKLIASGEEAGTWGTSTNENLSRIENAVGGCVAVNVTSPPSGSTWTSGTLTLTWLQQNTAASGTTGSTAVGAGRAKMVVFGDAASDLGGTVTVQVRGNTSSDYPERVFFVKNDLTGGESITFDLGGSGDYTLRNGRYAVLFTSATAKGTGTKIAANSLNNALAHPQISNLDFQDDTTAEITVADSQTSALTITDGTSSLAVFDSTNNQAVFAKVDINGGTVDAVTIGDSSSLGSNNVLIGASAGAAFSSNTDEVVSVGSSAMASGGGGSASNQNCVAIGFEAGKTATSSPQNVFIGSNAGETSDYTQHSVYVGFSAGKYHKGASGDYALRNVGIGAWTMTGADDSADGGGDCVAVGSYALKDYTNNDECVAIGSYALGKSASGNDNVAIGFKAIYDGTSVPTGANNIAIGSEALKAAVGAEENVCIGSNSGYALVSGDGNVMIGYESGKAETGSNKLYIENSDSAAPLIYGEFDNDKVQINSGQNTDTLTIRPTNGSYASSGINVNTTRAANAAFNFYEGTADSQVKFKVDGTGSVYNDTGTYSSPADYADMFEWEDGNPDPEDRIGMTVVVGDEGKIRPSREGDIPEDIFGVITGTACMVGNTAWSHWDEKFIKDEYGRTIHRSVTGKPGPVLNPEFNEAAVYVPRMHRPEWAPVGLVGRIHILIGQAVNPAWRKLRKVSETTEEWLVR